MNVNRISRVIENMRAQGLDQILVSTTASVYYLTGIWHDPLERMLVLHIKANGDVKLYANQLFALRGMTDIPMVEYDDTDDCIASVLAPDLAAGRLGIDKTWPSHFTIRLMQARPDIIPALGSQPVDDARMCKDEEELALMRVSSQMNVRVIRHLGESLREGMTEKEGQEIYTNYALEIGSPGNSFTPLVCFGEGGAQPHHDCDDTRLKDGDMVICDVGLMWKRYCSDMTRTFFFGNVSDEQKKVHAIVSAANRAGIAACRPGVKMKDIDRAARKVIEDAGYGPYFIHRTGHGIGLDVHEFPDCSATSETIAKPGMVFSVEPGIYLPGKFGVRVEDLVAITEDGCEVLTEGI